MIHTVILCQKYVKSREKGKCTRCTCKSSYEEPKTWPTLLCGSLILLCIACSCGGNPPLIQGKLSRIIGYFELSEQRDHHLPGARLRVNMKGFDGVTGQVEGGDRTAVVKGAVYCACNTTILLARLTPFERTYHPIRTSYSDHLTTNHYRWRHKRMGDVARPRCWLVEWSSYELVNTPNMS